MIAEAKQLAGGGGGAGVAGTIDVAGAAPAGYELLPEYGVYASATGGQEKWFVGGPEWDEDHPPSCKGLFKPGGTLDQAAERGWPVMVADPFGLRHDGEIRLGQELKYRSCGGDAGAVYEAARKWRDRHPDAVLIIKTAALYADQASSVEIAWHFARWFDLGALWCPDGAAMSHNAGSSRCAMMWQGVSSLEGFEPSRPVLWESVYATGWPQPGPLDHTFARADEPGNWKHGQELHPQAKRWWRVGPDPLGWVQQNRRLLVTCARANAPGKARNVALLQGTIADMDAAVALAAADLAATDKVRAAGFLVLTVDGVECVGLNAGKLLLAIGSSKALNELFATIFAADPPQLEKGYFPAAMLEDLLEQAAAKTAPAVEVGG